MLSNRTQMASRVLFILISFHILIIAASNYLVQFPVQVFGYETTWGAFTFPFIFLVTDLTVRILGQSVARKVIFFAMMPALFISYYFSTVFANGEFVGYEGLTQFNLFVFRIVIASFIAYVVGQLLDIFVFQRLRKLKQWWIAPVSSSLFGTMIDGFCFFTIAFYQSSDPFMAEHWVEIAIVDYCFKLGVSLLVFVPAYGVILSKIQHLFIVKIPIDTAKTI